MVSNLGLASRTCGELQLHVVLGLPQQPLRVQCCQRLRGKREARKGDILCWYHHGKGNERKPVSRGGSGRCCLRRVSKRRKARRQTGWRGGQAKGSGGKPGRWSGLCVRKERGQSQGPGCRLALFPEINYTLCASRGYKSRGGMLVIMGTAFWTTEEASCQELFKDIKMD